MKSNNFISAKPTFESSQSSINSIIYNKLQLFSNKIRIRII